MKIRSYIIDILSVIGLIIYIKCTYFSSIFSIEELAHAASHNFVYWYFYWSNLAVFS